MVRSPLMSDRAVAGTLHYELCRGLVDEGVVPARDVLQRRLDCSSDELDLAFETLAAEHGVVLHPGTRRAWIVHPFSLAPTAFLVEAGEKMWWGNCAWCSLGIASLVDAPCVITTTLGAEREQVRLTVKDGELDRSDFVVHFPIPMAHAWDNVVYTCSLMLLFKEKSDVAEWSARHEIPMGDVQPLGTVLALAKRWYGDHLRRDWRKRSVAEAGAIFSELGLSHPVWSLPAQEGRF